jgi:hypothetical protein
MKLSQQQKDLLIGTLLGDGHLASSPKGVSHSWRYRAIHKKKHQLYLFHKYEILEPFCKSTPVYAEVFDNRTKKTYQRWSFVLIQLPTLVSNIMRICFIPMIQKLEA